MWQEKELSNGIAALVLRLLSPLPHPHHNHHFPVASWRAGKWEGARRDKLPKGQSRGGGRCGIRNQVADVVQGLCIVVGSRRIRARPIFLTFAQNT